MGMGSGLGLGFRVGPTCNKYDNYPGRKDVARGYSQGGVVLSRCCA